MERPLDSRRDIVAGIAALGLAACAPQRASSPILLNLNSLPPESGPLQGGQDRALRMTAPVQINGQGPYTFVIDTGANHSVIALDLAEPLNLRRGRPAEVHGIAGAERADTAILDSLSIGHVTARRLRAPLLPRARLGLDGLLGVDVLRNRAVTLDFQNNRFTVGPSRPYVLTHSADAGRLRENLPADPSVVVVRARQRSGQLIIVDATVGDVPITAFLDSGSENTVGNMALFRALAGRRSPAAVGVLVNLMGVTGQQARGELRPIPALRLGGLSIGGASAVFTDLHIFDVWDLLGTPSILVGMDIMRHFSAIKLDFAGRLVTFHTPPRAFGGGRSIEVR